MNKNTDNRGLSLVELIVTITVMTVLVGILVPRFQVYINSRRQQACRANREALLNIYEKAVYDDQLLVAQTDLQMVINTSGSKMTTEYTNQAKDYLICPDAKETGHYSAHVNNNVAYITCDCHPDDICTLTFDNWVAKAVVPEDSSFDPSLVDPDPSYTIPAHSNPESEGSGDPEEEEVPPTDTTETVNTGIWPRVMDSQGRLDERWAAAGAQPGSTVTINAPVHFIDTTGAEIVIVKGPYAVKYEDANYPLGHGSNALPYVVAASGVKYTGGNLPVQIEQQIGHNEDVEIKKWVEYGKELKQITYKAYCSKKDCPNKNKEHVHDWSSWGAAHNGDKTYKTLDCGFLDCTDRNVRPHIHQWKNYNVKYEVTYYDTVWQDCMVVTCKDRNKNVHWHEVVDHTETKWVVDKSIYVYQVNYGDMLELNGVTYIYATNTGDSNYVEGLPTAEQTALGTNYNGWYVVPTLTK